MALDGKLLALARKQLEDIRHHNEDAQAAHRQEVYARLPRVQQIDTALRGQMRELAGLTLWGGKAVSEDLAKLEAENLQLQQERRTLITAAGYPADYTDDRYNCPDCRDTGYTDGRMCSCLRRIYNALVTQQLSTLLRGDERFSKFDLGLYPDLPNENGNNPRECMAIIRDFCEAYARQFDGRGPNLAFSGGPGLGKTFLSACIAKVVSENGWSVAYDSAAACLGAFEKERFSRDPEEKSAAVATVRQYLSCDLMILDDLGTEMNLPFSHSLVYQIVNERLVNRRKTVLSTNLSVDDIGRRYGEAVLSRIRGEYQIAWFFGEDIRKLKRDQ